MFCVTRKTNWSYIILCLANKSFDFGGRREKYIFIWACFTRTHLHTHIAQELKRKMPTLMWQHKARGTLTGITIFQKHLVWGRHLFELQLLSSATPSTEKHFVCHDHMSSSTRYSSAEVISRRVPPQYTIRLLTWVSCRPTCRRALLVLSEQDNSLLLTGLHTM
jgi:hypothetical protein